MRRIVGSVLVLLALSFVAACSTKDIVRNATDGKVNIDDDGKKVEIEGEGGEKISIEGGDELPKDFPEDIPLPEKYEVEGSGSFSSSGDQGKTGGVALVVDQAPDELSAWYEEELKAKEWEVQQTVKSGQGSVVSAKKGKMVANIVIAEKGSDKSSLAIQWAEEAG